MHRIDKNSRADAKLYDAPVQYDVVSAGMGCIAHVLLALMSAASNVHKTLQLNITKWQVCRQNKKVHVIRRHSVAGKLE